MTRIFVVNASPTIILAKIGRLDILSSLASEIWLPEPVVREILRGNPLDPACQMISTGWGRRISTMIPGKILEWGLGMGESSVLSVVLDRGEGIAVLDDAKARQCAKSLRLPVIGTVGLVLLAKKEGILVQAVPVLRDIVRAGLFIDVKLLKAVLPQVGETWDENGAANS